MDSRGTLQRCIELVLKPLARICLRHSLGIQDFIEQGKKAFIAAAEAELTAQGHKVTMRRLSTITGIHRKEIARIYKLGLSKEKNAHVASRVLTRWKTDPQFQTRSGRPRVLDYRGEQSSFHKLVWLVSKDLNPGTVLLDLERVESVKRTKTGLKLIGRSFVAGDDWAEGYEMLAQDMSSMIESVGENIELPEEERPNFHATTCFTNVAQEDLPEIQAWFLKQGSAFHRMVEGYLARFDLDLQPDSSKQGGSGVLLHEL